MYYHKLVDKTTYCLCCHAPENTPRIKFLTSRWKLITVNLGRCHQSVYLGMIAASRAICLSATSSRHFCSHCPEERGERGGRGEGRERRGKGGERGGRGEGRERRGKGEEREKRGEGKEGRGEGGRGKGEERGGRGEGKERRGKGEERGGRGEGKERRGKGEERGGRGEGKERGLVHNPKIW